MIKFLLFSGMITVPRVQKWCMIMNNALILKYLKSVQSDLFWNLLLKSFQVFSKKLILRWFKKYTSSLDAGSQIMEFKKKKKKNLILNNTGLEYWRIFKISITRY